MRIARYDNPRQCLLALTGAEWRRLGSPAYVNVRTNEKGFVIVEPAAHGLGFRVYKPTKNGEYRLTTPFSLLPGDETFGIEQVEERHVPNSDARFYAFTAPKKRHRVKKTGKRRNARTGQKPTLRVLIDMGDGDLVSVNGMSKARAFKLATQLQDEGFRLEWEAQTEETEAA